MKPQQVSASPHSPNQDGFPSTPVQPGCFTTLIPLAEGHGCLGTILLMVPHAHQPSPSCSWLKELNMSGKNIWMYECQQPVSLPRLKENPTSLSCITNKHLVGFSPNWRETGKRERNTRKQQSLRDMERVIKLGTGGRETHLCTGVIERKGMKFEI